MLIAGHPSGLFGLGLMYLTGQGTQVDHILAAKYFKRSIDIKQDWIGKSDAYFYAGMSLFCVRGLIHLNLVLLEIPFCTPSRCARVVKGPDLNSRSNAAFESGSVDLNNPLWRHAQVQILSAAKAAH